MFTDLSADKELDPRDRCLTKKEIYKRHQFGKRKRNEMDPIELAALRLKERVERRKQRIKKRDMTDPLERLKTAELPEMVCIFVQTFFEVLSTATFLPFWVLQ